MTLIKSQQSGLVKNILLIIVTIIILSYLDINLRDIFDSEVVQNSWEIIKTLSSKIWAIIIDFYNTYITPQVDKLKN